jgi:Protein of unknown function (DUF2568)
MLSSSAFRGINLALAFLLELAALAALAYWGYCTGNSTFTSLLLSIGIPLIAAILWGLFAAPRANYPNPLLKIAVKVLVFGAAFFALIDKDQTLLAILFGVLVIGNLLLLRVTKPVDTIDGS